MGSRPTASHFDDWYADMLASSVKDELIQRYLGLPPRLLSSSLLGWEGVGEVVDALALAPGDTLLDLACGRGGYGLEIAGRTGAALVGVDFSAEAVCQAEEQARRLGRSAEFRVGDMAATGLESGSVRAVLCVDAIQFAERPDLVCGELRRVLAPGGRAVLTCWEPADRDDDTLASRLRQVQLAEWLVAAGFEDVQVRDRRAWRESEHALWQAAAGLDPGPDLALTALRDEALRALAVFHQLRRVLASATSPRRGAETDSPPGA